MGVGKCEEGEERTTIMTVKELMKELKDYPQDGDDGSEGQYRDSEAAK